MRDLALLEAGVEQAVAAVEALAVLVAGVEVDVQPLQVGRGPRVRDARRVALGSADWLRKYGLFLAVAAALTGCDDCFRPVTWGPPAPPEAE